MNPAFVTLFTIGGGFFLSLIFLFWRHFRTPNKSWSNEAAASVFMNSMTMVTLACLCFNVLFDLVSRTKMIETGKAKSILNTISIEGSEPLILFAFGYSMLMVISAIRRAIDGE